jgi:hypothetical protein
MENHVEELLKKLNQQECMVSSLLTGSNQQKIDYAILEKIETLCLKMGEEVSFIKNFFVHNMKDQIALLYMMIKEVHNPSASSSMLWTSPKFCNRVARYR